MANVLFKSSNSRFVTSGSCLTWSVSFSKFLCCNPFVDGPSKEKIKSLERSWVISFGDDPLIDRRLRRLRLRYGDRIGAPPLALPRFSAEKDGDNQSKLEEGEIEEGELVDELSDVDGIEEEEDPHPLGNVIRVSGRREQYESLAYDGNIFNLEDPVLLAPDEPNQKPGMVIIKGIAKTPDQKLMVTGQVFYRPEESQRRYHGYWKSRNRRELFYSFNRKEFPAECVMHKFVVHFILQNKQIPPRSLHPGFIVQKIYDTKQKQLFNLTDKNYGDRRRKEIELLIQKTKLQLGDLPDIEAEDAVTA